MTTNNNLLVELFVEELPKGATGKLQRIGLAQRIGLGFGSFVSGEF